MRELFANKGGVIDQFALRIDQSRLQTLFFSEMPF